MGQNISRENAEQTFYYDRADDASKLPGFLGKIVPAKLKYCGWYGCTWDTKRTAFVLRKPTK